MALKTAIVRYSCFQEMDIDGRVAFEESFVTVVFEENLLNGRQLVLAACLSSPSQVVA